MHSDFGSWIANVTCLFLFANSARAVCGDFQSDSDGYHSRARETGGVTWLASAYRLRQDTTKRIHNMDSFGIMGQVTPFWSDQLYCHHSITVASPCASCHFATLSDVKFPCVRGSVKSARKRLQSVRFEVTSSMHRQWASRAGALTASVGSMCSQSLLVYQMISCAIRAGLLIR